MEIDRSDFFWFQRRCLDSGQSEAAQTNSLQTPQLKQLGSSDTRFMQSEVAEKKI